MEQFFEKVSGSSDDLVNKLKAIKADDGVVVQVLHGTENGSYIVVWEKDTTPQSSKGPLEGLSFGRLEGSVCLAGEKKNLPNGP